jgi:hypothetical protein
VTLVLRLPAPSSQKLHSLPDRAEGRCTVPEAEAITDAPIIRPVFRLIPRLRMPARYSPRATKIVSKLPPNRLLRRGAKAEWPYEGGVKVSKRSSLDGAILP